MTLLAAWSVVLSKFSGQDELLVGIAMANRSCEELEGIIGFFVNALPLKFNLSSLVTVAELLEYTKKKSLEAQENQDIPLEQIVELINPARSTAYNPLFQVMFVWQNNKRERLDLPGLEINDLAPAPHTTSKFDLTLDMQESGANITGKLKFATTLFKQQTVQQFLNLYRIILERIIATTSISSLYSVSDATHKNPWLDAIPITDKKINNSSANRTVHEQIEERAKIHPAKIAVCSGSEKLSYGELNKQANQLAHYLIKQGVKREDKIIVSLETSTSMIVCLLAILKAGACYVPVDVTNPIERTKFIIRDTKTHWIVATTSIQQELASFPHLWFFDGDLAAIAQESTRNPSISCDGDNLAYCIYTSGSTGFPKGTLISHKAVNLRFEELSGVQLDECTRFLQLTSISFDQSVTEIWGTLLNGGCIVLFTHPIKSAEKIGECIRSHHINTAVLTTSVFNYVVSQNVHELSSLKQILVGGEALSPPHVSKMCRALPSLPLVNVYGPTECTVIATTYQIQETVPENWKSIPIGKATTNSQTYILDKNLHQLPQGVVGELYLGGPGLARGYLNNPDLTAEKFIPHPFSKQAGERLYATGDLARIRYDGELEFLGRGDKQIKIRGMRVELGEIESMLAEHPAVEDVAVICVDVSAVGKQLFAYIQSKQKKLDGPYLQSYLQKKLPAPMVPANYVILDSLPHLISGKIDRKKLTLFAAQQGVGSSAIFVAPKTKQEKDIAAILQNILKIDKIGTSDNFFELGGNSLKTIQLVSQLQGLELALFLENPTIQGIIKALNRDIEKATGLRLVKLQPHGKYPPLFAAGIWHTVWEHPELSDDLFASGLEYAELASKMAPDHPP